MRQRTIAALLAAVLLVPLVLAQVENTAFMTRTYDNCVVLDYDNRVTLSWNLVGATSLELAIQGTTKAGWMAMGVSLDGTMKSSGPGSDIILAYQSGDVAGCGNGCVKDHWAQYRDVPALDSVQDVTQIASNVDDASNIVTVEFDRLVDTGDTAQDRPILVDGNKTAIIWAVSLDGQPLAEETFGKHSFRGVRYVDFTGSYECLEASNPVGYYESPDKTWRSSWTITPDGQFLEMTVEADTTGWVGVGFSQGLTMPRSDVVVAWVDDTSGATTIMDAWTTGYAVPLPDVMQGGEDNVELLDSWQQGSTTGFTFRRPLVTTDYTNDVIIDPGTMGLLYAYGTADGDANTLEFEQHYMAGATPIDLLSGRVSRWAYRGQKLHGSLMLVAWLGAASSAATLARYGKIVNPSWFPRHRILGTFALAATLVGYVLILFIMGPQSLAGSRHGQLGTVLLLLAILQVLLGRAANAKFDKDRSAPPVYPDKVHWWVGRTTLLVAFWTMWLGVGFIRVPLLTDAYVAAVVAYALFVLYNEFAEGQVHESAGGTEMQHAATKDAGEGPRNVVGGSTGSALETLMIAFMVIALLALLTAGTRLMPVGGFGLLATLANFFNRSGLRQIDFTINSWEVETVDTSYVCTYTDFPGVTTDLHAIMIEPIVDNENLLHHMVVFAMNDVSGGLPADQSSCNMPGNSYPTFVWAPGGSPMIPPDEAGIRITPTSRWAIQFHYDNPTIAAGQRDSSGVRIHATSDLREFDAAFFIQGRKVTNAAAPVGIVIPAGNPAYSEMADCQASVLEDPGQPDVMHIFAIAHHMHKLGRVGKTEVFRFAGGTETVLYSPWFDFNDQTQTNVDVTLYKNDVLRTTCTWDSTGAAGTTYGGDGTDDEMCLSVFAYYPILNGIGDCLTDAV